MNLFTNHPRAFVLAAMLLTACLVILVVVTTREPPALASPTDHRAPSDVAIADDGWGPPGAAPPDPEAVGSGPPATTAGVAPTAAVSTAEAAMVAFARSTAGDPAWWPGVVGYLTPQARLDYLGVDPSQVPFTEVTGAGQALAYAEADGVEAFVRVPTDAGDYLVRLSPAADGSFAVIALTPVSVEIPSSAMSSAQAMLPAGAQ